jgi:hypothetical protein
MGRAASAWADQAVWVPRTSSTSRDQAILVDQTTDAGLSSDAVLLKIDWFGQRFQRRRAEQETGERTALVPHDVSCLPKLQPSTEGAVT